MIVRPAALADRPAVLALAEHFAAVACAPDTPYGHLLRVDLARLPAMVDIAIADGVVFVVELEYGADLRVDHDLVAFLSLQPREHALSGERYAEATFFWIEPAYRSGLIAGWLMRQAEAWALAEGCVFLKMPAPVGTAIGSYYDRCGYQPVETAFLKRVA